jgi:thiopeptide-type bacteriocin biosynthesis protein
LYLIDPNVFGDFQFDPAPKSASDAEWLEVRCAFPINGIPSAPVIPWQMIRSALSTWRQSSTCDRFFFMRKPPGLRLRFLSKVAKGNFERILFEWLSGLARNQHVVSYAPAIYEPEEHRFGGARGMAIAHLIWSADAEMIVEYECLQTARHGSVPRSAIWAVLVNSLQRQTLDDSAEMWDVWCMLADTLSDFCIEDALVSRYYAMAHTLFNPTPQWLVLLTPEVRRLVERSMEINRIAADELRNLVTAGTLKIGIRSWLTSNALFQANRWGLGFEATQFHATALAMRAYLAPNRAVTVPK